jgi:hypothetical protein
VQEPWYQRWGFFISPDFMTVTGCIRVARPGSSCAVTSVNRKSRRGRHGCLRPSHPAARVAKNLGSMSLPGRLWLWKRDDNAACSPSTCNIRLLRFGSHQSRLRRPNWHSGSRQLACPTSFSRASAAALPMLLDARGLSPVMSFLS